MGIRRVRRRRWEVQEGWGADGKSNSEKEQMGSRRVRRDGREVEEWQGTDGKRRDGK